MNLNLIVHKLPRLIRRHKLVQLLTFFRPIQVLSFNNGATVYTDFRDAAARQVLIKKVFEPDFFAIAKPFLCKGGTFFDVGANLGFCTFGIMPQLSSAIDVNYHLFEANHQLCELLFRSQADLHPNQKLTVNSGCVSDQLGDSFLQVTAQETGRSHITTNNVKKRESFKVQNIVLDDYIEQKKIQSIQFLKIDIEGWEPYALAGMSKSLESGLIEAVYIEISTDNLTRAGFSAGDCLAPLKKAGFDLYWCKPQDLTHRSRLFQVNGQPLPLAKLESFPEPYQTDILAVHSQSNVVKLCV